MDDARFHAIGGAGYRRRPFRLNGVEALAAPLEQNADQIDDDVGIARRGLDRLRKAHIRLHRFYLPDSAERLQMAGQLRAAHRDANTVLAVGERAQNAIAAGCDVVLHCNGDMSEMTAVAAGVPPLAGQAARRAEGALAARKTATLLDIAATRTEFFRLMAGSWQPAEPDA